MPAVSAEIHVKDPGSGRTLKVTYVAFAVAPVVGDFVTISGQNYIITARRHMGVTGTRSLVLDVE